jgi:uncharacterized protein (DUF2062 family)
VQNTASAVAPTTRRGDAPPSGVEFGVGDCYRNQPISGDDHAPGDQLAWVFGLNQIASQIGAHAMTPLHLLLFIPFIELGVHLFHTRRLPLIRQQIEHLSHHPWRLIRDIWQWEWHALIVWGLVAAIAMPLLAIYIRRALVLLMRRHRTLMRSRPALNPSE